LPLSACFRPVLLADRLVSVYVHGNDVFAGEEAERREDRLDQELAGPWDTGAQMAVVVGETLVKQDSIAQGDLLLEFLKLFLVEVRFPWLL